eukprot:XP_001704239.1 Hypothetical protein GL50803_34526 [Giardia lamblia ATCC 50803]
MSWRVGVCGCKQWTGCRSFISSSGRAMRSTKGV